MFDHIGLRTKDFDALASFYEKALAPLGYEKLMSFDGGAGLAETASRRFGSSRRTKPRQASISRLHPTAAQRSTHSTPLRSRLAARITARPAFATTRRTITPPSSSIPTATIWRRSATRARVRRALTWTLSRAEQGPPANAPPPSSAPREPRPAAGRADGAPARAPRPSPESPPEGSPRSLRPAPRKRVRRAP